jgi:hypothetical protein
VIPKFCFFSADETAPRLCAADVAADVKFRDFSCQADEPAVYQVMPYRNSVQLPQIIFQAREVTNIYFLVMYIQKN